MPPRTCVIGRQPGVTIHENMKDTYISLIGSMVSVPPPLSGSLVAVFYLFGFCTILHFADNVQRAFVRPLDALNVSPFGVFGFPIYL